MKHILLGVLFILIIASLTSCGMIENTYIKDNGALKADAQKIWTRPFEYGIEPIGETLGFSSQTMIMGFTIAGDKPAAKYDLSPMTLINPMTLASSVKDVGQLEQIAIGKAVDGAKADGIYITRLSTDMKGLWPFYIKRSALVKGKALKLKELGIVEQERNDNYFLWKQIGGVEDKDTSLNDLIGKFNFLRSSKK